jgi:hypothetical protein
VLTFACDVIAVKTIERQDSDSRIRIKDGKGSINLFRFLGDLDKIDVKGDIDTLALMTVFILLVLSLRRMVIMSRPRMIVICALLVKGRFKLNAAVGAKTQNCPLY